MGSILTVDGARRAENLNNNYFLNGRHTPLLIMVKGGSLTDESFNKLKEYMNGIRGEAGQHSFMVLETEAADNRTGFNTENRPEVEVKDLAAILQKDELSKTTSRTTGARCRVRSSSRTSTPATQRTSTARPHRRLWK